MIIQNIKLTALFLLCCNFSVIHSSDIETAGKFSNLLIAAENTPEGHILYDAVDSIIATCSKDQRSSFREFSRIISPLTPLLKKPSQYSHQERINIIIKVTNDIHAISQIQEVDHNFVPSSNPEALKLIAEIITEHPSSLQAQQIQLLLFFTKTIILFSLEFINIEPINFEHFEILKRPWEHPIAEVQESLLYLGNLFSLISKELESSLPNPLQIDQSINSKKRKYLKILNS